MEKGIELEQSQCWMPCIWYWSNATTYV